VAEADAPSYEMVEPEVLVKMLEDQMREAATSLDFEAAARLRDQLFEVKARMAGTPSRTKVAADVKAGGRR
jgi:excinuclease ABC subunit B